jgi:dTDP-4-amino-4,6-dideoxygalactose transaminase
MTSSVPTTMSLQLPPRHDASGPRPSYNLEVPVMRLDNSDPTSLGELMCAVERVVRADDFTLGAELVEFEREFGRLCGTGYAVGVSSGTDALALALQGLGIGPGDEVIVPANSFIATAEAVTLTGARPRLVDVDPQTHLLTAEEVERNLDGRVRGVIPVHLYGRTVDLDPIITLARERGVFVVEDACQAHGASYRGRRVGSVGDAGAFSFYPTKNLGAWGDGGAVVTSDTGLAERVRLLRSHGEQPRYTHRMPGGTSRLHTIQAAVLRAKLARLEEQNARRRRLGGVSWLSAQGYERRRRNRHTATTSSISSVSSPTTGMRCVRISRSGASPPPSTTRSRSTCRRRTPIWDCRAATCRSWNGWPSRSARFRCFPP